MKSPAIASDKFTLIYLFCTILILKMESTTSSISMI